MIRRLRTKFHLSNPAVCRGCGLRDRLREKFIRHKMRTGAARQIPTVFQQFHGSQIDFAIPSRRILNRMLGFGESRRIQDDHIILFSSSFQFRQQFKNISALKAYDLFQSIQLRIAPSLFYSQFRGDKEGILFNERLYQTPIRKDVWDADKKRIPARNMIIVASTGGGKSVTSKMAVSLNFQL